MKKSMLFFVMLSMTASLYAMKFETLYEWNCWNTVSAVSFLEGEENTEGYVVTGHGHLSIRFFDLPNIDPLQWECAYKLAESSHDSVTMNYKDGWSAICSKEKAELIHAEKKQKKELWTASTVSDEEGSCIVTSPSGYLRMLKVPDGLSLQTDDETPLCTFDNALVASFSSDEKRLVVGYEKGIVRVFRVGRVNIKAART